MCSKNDIDKPVLMEWQGKDSDKVDEKTKTLSNKKSSKVDKSLL